MPKRSSIGNAGVNKTARAPQSPTTATEFASETNVAEVRRQNQQSASRAAQQNNPTE
ncbi:MAG: gamma-type small acid-soluble spore protein [Clostridia bacterium]